MDQFNSFAESFKRFESLLRSLVVYTLLLATVSTVAEYRHFEPDFMAITWLVAVIGGMTGIITEYIGARPRVLSEVGDLLNARPDQAARPVLLWLVGAALAMPAFYWRVVNGDQLGTVLFVGLGTYLFFKGITRSLVAIELSARQASQWNAMSTDERVVWIGQQHEFKAEQRKVRSDLQRIQDEAKQTGREMRAATQNLNRSMRALRNREARERWARARRRVHGWTIGFRKRLAGDRLLLPVERQVDLWKRIRAESAWEELGQTMRAESVKRMRSGQLEHRSLEGTNLTLYEDQAWTYVDLEPEVTQAMATRLLSQLEPIRQTWSRVVAVLPLDGTISLQAEQELQKAGLQVYREWVAAEPLADTEGPRPARASPAVKPVRKRPVGTRSPKQS
jgi:hypothetical protein